MQQVRTVVRSSIVLSRRESCVPLERLLALVVFLLLLVPYPLHAEDVVRRHLVEPLLHLHLLRPVLDWPDGSEHHPVGGSRSGLDLRRI